MCRMPVFEASFDLMDQVTKLWRRENDDVEMRYVEPIMRWWWIALWDRVKIITEYARVFIGRTEVDMKDKWRNMTKFEICNY